MLGTHTCAGMIVVPPNATVPWGDGCNQCYCPAPFTGEAHCQTLPCNGTCQDPCKVQFCANPDAG